MTDRHVVPWALLAIVALAVALLTFGGTRIVVYSSDATVYAARSSWWGLSESRREIRWMVPTHARAKGETELRTWCFQAVEGRLADGAWYPYFIPYEDL